MGRPRLGAAFRLGLQVIIALGALTAIEYALAVAMDSGATGPLMVLAIIKGALILYYFMHVAQLWRREE
jgi:hypothetical protein